MGICEEFYDTYTILKSGNGMDIGDGVSTWGLSYEGVIFIFSKDRFGTYTIERLTGSVKVGYHCNNVSEWCDKRGIDVEQLTLDDFQVMIFETGVANV